MMLILYKMCLAMVAVINLLPVVGLFSAERLAQGYGIEVSGNDLQVLLRHRALLFGIIGGFVVYALFVPLAAWPAMVMAGVSMVGFMIVALMFGPINEALRTVFLADVVGIVALTIAMVLHAMGLDQLPPTVTCRGV